ncbi:MAG TPA: sugar transferase [Acidimicrobiales bacterium]|nr:sugar transferase [Acidimicrobiales bacterium]
MSIAFDREALELGTLDVRDPDKVVVDLRRAEKTSNPTAPTTAPEILVRREASATKRFLKRAIDVVGASVLLVVAAPIAACIALAIRVTSGKHVLFKQTRVGLDGALFTMYKFRTMVRDAEDLRHQLVEHNEADGLLFKIADDPRVTRLGRVLRPLGLDELPQLLNVLKGNMSLVGPRPALPVEVDKYDERLKARLWVKPGLTGLWQINGRHELSFDDYARFDLHYVDNWSLMLDLWVLVATLPALLRRRGAY